MITDITFGTVPSFEDDKIIYTMNGEEHCNVEMALSELLKNEVLFANSRKYICSVTNNIEDATIVLFVNCNDVFHWGYADSESVTIKEVGSLYKIWKLYKYVGVDKWCCLKRKQRPQKPVEELIRQAGIWDESMDTLPLRE